MKEFIETTVGTLLVLLLIAAMVGVATLLGACAGPVPITVVRVMPPEPSTGRPTCMVVMSPPPTPPISYNELAYRCRDPEGRKLAADDLCMTTAEVTEMSRFTAQLQVWSTQAWHGCAVAEPGIDPAVGVIR